MIPTPIPGPSNSHPFVSSSLNPSSPASSPSHRVLSLYYPSLQPLSSLFPPSLLKEKDSARFASFLDQTLVGSISADGLPLFNVLENEDNSIAMSEVSSLSSRVRLEYELMERRREIIGVESSFIENLCDLFSRVSKES